MFLVLRSVAVEGRWDFVKISLTAPQIMRYDTTFTSFAPITDSLSIPIHFNSASSAHPWINLSMPYIVHHNFFRFFVRSFKRAFSVFFYLLLVRLLQNEQPLADRRKEIAIIFRANLHIFWFKNGIIEVYGV